MPSWGRMGFSFPLGCAHWKPGAPQHPAVTKVPSDLVTHPWPEPPHQHPLTCTTKECRPWHWPPGVYS